MPTAITIVSTLPVFSKAPEQIQKASIGITIDLPRPDQLQKCPPKGNVAMHDNSYPVLRRDVLAELRKQRRWEAARFLEALILGEYLFFPRQCCKPIH